MYSQNNSHSNYKDEYEYENNYEYSTKDDSPNRFELASASELAEMDLTIFDCKPDCNSNGALPMFPVPLTLPTARTETAQQKKSNVRESSSPISMQNRQRRRKQQKQQYQQPSLSPTKRQTASPIDADPATSATKANANANANANSSHTHGKSVTDDDSPTKNSTRVPRNTSNNNGNNRLDMRYDDNEFAFAAHLIMLHLEKEGRQDYEDAGCVNWSDFNHLWNYVQGGDESQSSGSRLPPDRADTLLTEDLLAEFQFALKHRLKYISLRSPSHNDKHVKEEDPIVVLTRQVAKLIAKSGFPKPLRQPRDSSRRRDTTNDKHQQQFPVRDTDDSTTFDSEPNTSNSAPVKIQTSSPIDATPPERFQAEKVGEKIVPAADSGHATQPQPGLSASSTQAQNYQHPQPARFDVQPDHAEYIRQQYQRELQDRLQPPTTWPYQEPVFEISSSIHPDTVVDAYFEEEEVIAEPILDPAFHAINNLLIDSNDIFIGIDRTFEEETVVMRQVAQPPPAHFPIVSSDGSFSHEIIVPAHDEIKSRPSYVPPQLSPKRSIPRQRIMDEAKRVTNMMNLTSHPQVKASCRMRLDDLRRELERLTVYNDHDDNDDAARTKEMAGSAVQSAVYFVEVSPTRHFFPDPEDEKESIQELHVFSNDSYKQIRSSHIQEKHENPEGDKTSNLVSLERASLHAAQDQNTQPVHSIAPSEPSPFVAPVWDEEEAILCDTTHFTGKWKDRLLDCCRFGPCHASVVTSVFLPLMALGQVMVRLQNVRWIALPSPRPRDAYRIAILLTMFWITINCLIYYLALVKLTKLILFVAVNSALYLYYLANVIRTRLLVRRRFGILNARTAEDTVVGGLVPFLCLMQLLRHTCDYNTLAGFVCTANGVSSQVKLILPPLVVAPSDQHKDDDYSLSTLSIPLR